MRRTLLIALLCGIAVAPASAQQAGSDDIRRCVDVEIGGQRAPYSCINQALRRKVDDATRAADGLNVKGFDAKSPDLSIGIVNTSAVRQQYGRNFGISAFPYRPPVGAPLVPPR